MRALLFALLRLFGKSDRKVAAVFGFSRAECHAAVVHLREGAPEVPVWLFTTAEPLPETAALCEKVVFGRNSLVLVLQAEARLWQFWVALSVGTWTGGHGKWLLKLAPFLIPPCRVLLLNGSGDFFPGTPGNVSLHWRRVLRGAAQSAGNRIKDIGQAIWLLISYHIWRSGPVRRVKDLGLGVWSSPPIRRVRDWTLGAWVSPPVRRARDVTRSVWLLVFSTAMRWCGYPDRHLFEWLHGKEALRVHADGASVARFELKGTRWVLSQEESAFDLLALFGDERTFAVSRQMSFREWKPMLFATAPFRTLQPEEASPVMAPLADTILVDASKLKALGCTETSMDGTAWLRVFWKAAAAGWCSYSVGQSNPLKRQPDYPVQERAFIWRVLFDAELRRLGPRDPDLARGSVAFAPAFQSLARTGTERLKVLLVSPFLPYPLSHGGAVRIYNLCRALRDRVDFTLIAIREEQDVTDYAKLHEVFQSVYVLDKDEHAVKNDQLPAQVREHQSRSLRALIADLSRESDLVQFEYTHMAAFRDSAPGVPALLVEHDLTFSLYRQLAESRPGEEAKREYLRWLEFEKKWLAAYNGVWTVSDEDRESAIQESGRNPDRTFSIPNGVDTGRFVPREEPTPAPEIFFVGSFRHLPNILGFERLLHDVMPRVWRKIPNARLRVVAGPRHEEFWDKFASKQGLRDLDGRIEIHGFVEDLRPLYAKASVVVVPLEVSAGTNIKVLEAMACGKAVVSTPVGCAGLGLVDGHDTIIRREWADFAIAVCGVLSDAALRSRISVEARRTVEERFSWTAIAECGYRSYRTLV